MTEKGGIANDPNALVVDPKQDRPYLGDMHVTQALFSEFSRRVLADYDDFLHAKRDGDAVQADVTRIVREYADIFMGRDKRYAAAPWQSTSRIGGRLRAWYDIPGTMDPGVGYFTFLADVCMQAATELAQGADEKEIGTKLHEILEDGYLRFLGVRW